MNWRERIVIDPTIHHGKPCIKGNARFPVSVIIGQHLRRATPSSGSVESWPQLSADDIRAATKIRCRGVCATPT